MNPLRTSVLLTEISDLSGNISTQLLKKVQILQMENAEFKRRYEASKQLNLSLQQTLVSLSKKGRVDFQTLERLQQLSMEASTPTSPQTLGQLRQFYQQEIKKIQCKHSRQLDQLYFKHQEEIRLLRDTLEQQNKDKLANEREQMLKQVKQYLMNQKNRVQNSKQNKDNRCGSSQRNRKSLCFSSKSKIFSSPMNSLQNSFKQNSRGDIQSEQSYIKYSTRGKVATQMQCNNCHNIFSPNQFVLHVNLCRSNQYILQRSNLSQYKNLDALLKRKQQIQEQLQNIASKNQKHSRQILQTDLDEIVYIINKSKNLLNQQQIQAILQNSTARFPLPKKANKKDIIVKRVR